MLFYKMEYLDSKIELFKKFIIDEIIQDNKLTSLEQFKQENINKFHSLDIEEQDLINNIINNPAVGIQKIEIKNYIQYLEILPIDKQTIKRILYKVLDTNMNDETIDKSIIHVKLLREINSII